VTEVLDSGAPSVIQRILKGREKKLWPSLQRDKNISLNIIILIIV
jgi:hypothetical protein